MKQKVEICGMDTSSLKRLTFKESEELLMRIKEGDEKAREEFILANVRLVLSIIRRFDKSKVSALIKKLYKRKEITNFIRKCEFTVGGRIYIVNGFLDSGNRLRYKNDPIIIVSPKFAAKLMKNEVFSLVRPRYSTISTIAGEKVIKIYKISRIKIYNGTSVNIINNVMLGIAEREFMSGGEYDLILGTVFA